MAGDKELYAGYIRKAFRALDLTGTEENRAYAEYMSAAPVTPLGHQEYAVSGGVVPLASIPAGAKRMHLRCLNGGIFWTDFPGDTPSTAHGFPIKVDEWLLYDSEPSTDFKMISDTVADVRIAYYG